MRPYFAVYSTFLQRAYDQIVHDVCLQNLPVCILSDHAGLVGDDGKTHHGVLSVPMLQSIPNLTLLAPRDTQQIQEAVRASIGVEGPCVIQYPKDGIEPYAQNLSGEGFAVGRWQRLREGADAVVLAYGRMTKHVLLAAQVLCGQGIELEVIDCCSIKPMDTACLERLAAQGRRIFTVEEGELIGGFGAEVERRCAELGLEEPVCAIGIENRFITHGAMDLLLEECGLMPEQLAERIGREYREWENKHVR